ncbi:MAG: hypothetical protein WDN08_05350 [Rhizomicrobium sp.]
MDDAPDLANALGSTGGWIWANGWPCRCAKAIPLAALIARYGPAAKLEAVRLKMRCETCGKPPSSFTLPSPGKEPDPIPLDRVPSSMRRYC